MYASDVKEGASAVCASIHTMNTTMRQTGVPEDIKQFAGKSESTHNAHRDVSRCLEKHSELPPLYKAKADVH